jgi:ATP-binding cassette subfamily B protein
VSKRRRFLAPEVVQTSAMDCGPASLKCLLEGFGTHVSYGRLREACQTDVDGTSIDTIEEIAKDLGLEARQIVIPREHVLLPGHEPLPAIAVVRLPNNLTHFLVVWRRHGPLVQVMDPAVGRRWVPVRRFTQSLHAHEALVPATAWREWATRDATLKAFARRLAIDGVGRRVIDRVLDRAQADPGWRSLAAVDAAARMTHAIVGAKGARRGSEAARLFERVFARAAEEEDGASAIVPPSYWSVRRGPPGGDGVERVGFRGAVLCAIRGGNPPLAASAREPESAARPARRLSPELSAALAEPATAPWRTILGFLHADGALAPGLLTGSAVLAAGGVIVEALLFRALLEGGAHLKLSGQRAGAVLAIVVFVLSLLLLEFPSAWLAWRVGRQLESRLRIAFLRKIPRLGDRYFQSRPASDMAERSHSIHLVRQLPQLGTRFTRSLFELLSTAAAIAWLSPANAPLAVAAATIALTVPFLAQPVLRERDMRVRTHVGALSRFYLDALLGLVAIRTHAAERTVRREHEGLLVEWARAARRLQRTAVSIEAIQLVTGFGLAAWLLLHSFGRGGEPASVTLLVAYWVLGIPVLGRELAQLAWQYPAHRNLVLRLVEPLGALEDKPEGEPSAAPSDEPHIRSHPPQIAFDDVTVRAAGHTLLERISLTIPAGSHVAIVGASGAGKSSLLGLLLGWHRPSYGRVVLDDEILDGGCLERLRGETAWVDPTVHLWNQPLACNLEYGARREGHGTFAEAIDTADLYELLERLPEGLQTPLGEGGGLISGGEGQRVRFGRAVLRRDARLVLLDEPFRGLERDRRRRLLERARRVWAQATLLCVTHDISETLTFNRVLVVHEGLVVEDGEPAALALRAESRYHAMIRAEERVRAEYWEHGRWRRLTLDHGELHEEARREVTA